MASGPAFFAYKSPATPLARRFCRKYRGFICSRPERNSSESNRESIGNPRNGVERAPSPPQQILDFSLAFLDFFGCPGTTKTPFCTSYAERGLFSVLHAPEIYSTRHWQAARAASAVAWEAGVTPAQQEERISIGASGKKARSSIAFEITQISVQTP